MNDLCDDVDKETLHLHAIEDMIYGLDINQHAIHIGASALTLIPPNVDYNKMNLFCMSHGISNDDVHGENGDGYTGSLDLLIDNPKLNLFMSDSEKIHATGFKEKRISLDNSIDLVIMNPPYTRNSIRNGHLSENIKRRIQAKEVEIGRRVSESNRLWRDVINQSSIATFFFPMADGLLNEQNGVLAMVLPYTANVNTAGIGLRRLLTFPNRFILEAVITSHDERKVNFSGNTKIHESLVIARRPTEKNKNKPAAFISLKRNPNSIFEAYDLGKAINLALEGDYKNLKDKYGTIVFRDQDSIRNTYWNDAAFYNTNLVDFWKNLQNNCSLIRLGEFSEIFPRRKRMADAYEITETMQNKYAKWFHKTDEQNTMLTEYDMYIYAKQGKERMALNYWECRSNLLISNRFTKNHKTLAILE